MADEKKPGEGPDAPPHREPETPNDPGDIARERTTAAGAGAEQSGEDTAEAVRRQEAEADAEAARRRERERAEQAEREARQARMKEAQAKAGAAAGAARGHAERSFADARSSISDSDDRTIAIVNYVLYLLTGPTGGISAIVGVILAYIKKDTADPGLASHFDFQIRTFWIGLVASLISILLMFVIIGIPLFIALAVWWLLRSVVGLVRVLDRKPIPDPHTWLV